MTTNGGPAHLYRNDLATGHRGVRLALRGSRGNRDGIGARIRARLGTEWLTRVVRTGSSYLSQSELPVTLGLGRRAEIDEVVIEWPSGAREKIGRLAAGRFYTIAEGKGIVSERGLGTGGQPSRK